MEADWTKILAYNSSVERTAREGSEKGSSLLLTVNKILTRFCQSAMLDNKQQKMTPDPSLSRKGQTALQKSNDLYGELPPTLAERIFPRICFLRKTGWSKEESAWTWLALSYPNF
jgi:hypothetical protein